MVQKPCVYRYNEHCIDTMINVSILWTIVLILWTTVLIHVNMYQHMMICIDTFLYRIHVLVLAWPSIDTLGPVSIQRPMYRYIYMLYRYKWGHLKFLAYWSIILIHENHISKHWRKIKNFLIYFILGHFELHPLMPHLCIYLWYDL